MTGMYFALPTKATAAQVHAELAKCAEELALPETPNLVHARAGLEQAGVDEDGDGAFDGREWFTRKRGLLFPLGVGTIDQVLQAVIRSRHVFVRLTGLSGKVLVLDEVHDVDAHMATLLGRLMWWCGRFGIPVVLMSATLPATDRGRLIEQWRAWRNGVGPRRIEVPRPVQGGQQIVWAGAAADQESRPFGVGETNEQRPAVEVHHCPEQELADWLRARVRTGGNALVIRNLVRQAGEAHRALQEEIETWDRKPELIFITGHTPTAQRRQIENRLREQFGPGSARRPHAIVVGTQVLQHSLDIDFDLLVSDLAPINEIIQRLGRVHRHARAEQRVSENPQLALLKLPTGNDGLKFPQGLHNVYPHALLLRTWHVLEDRAELKLPEETADLVHQVYCEPVQLQGRLRKRWEQAEKSMAAQDGNDETKVRRFYLQALRPGDSLTRLTSQPTIAARTRKDTPWKDWK